MHEFVLNAFEEIRNVQMMISVFRKLCKMNQIKCDPKFDTS